MKKLFLSLFIGAIFFSCKVTFVPTKSASMIANVLDIQNSTTSLYDAVIASNDKSYVSYQNDYGSIGSKIDSIVEVNKIRPHGGNIYAQSVLLQKYFKKYSADHKTRGALTNGELRVYRDYLKSFIKPILVSELSLK